MRGEVRSQVGGEGERRRGRRGGRRSEREE